MLRLEAGLQPALVASSSPTINNSSHLQRRTRFSLMTLFSLTAKLPPHNNNLSGKAPGCDKAPSLDLPSKQPPNQFRMWIRPNSPSGFAVSRVEFTSSWTIDKRHVGSHQQTAILPPLSVSISVRHFAGSFFYCFEFSSHVDIARTRQVKRTRQRMQHTFTDGRNFFFFFSPSGLCLQLKHEGCFAMPRCISKQPFQASIWEPSCNEIKADASEQ